jgi:hypothetical protein
MNKIFKTVIYEADCPRTYNANRQENKQTNKQTNKQRNKPTNQLHEAQLF